MLIKYGYSASISTALWRICTVTTLSNIGIDEAWFKKKKIRSVHPLCHPNCITYIAS